MALIEKLNNKDFLGNILDEYFHKRVEIVKVTITSDVTASGESYCCPMMRIKIVYSFENEQEYRSLSMISKCFPEEQYKAKFVTDMKLFDCEFGIYDQVIPLLSTLDYQEKISPKTYGCVSQPLSLLLLEDLSELNYKVVQRKNGLDFEHCLLVVEKLAYFHAASFALFDKESTIITQFNQSVFQKGSVAERIFSASYEEIIKVSRNVPELNKYVEKLKFAKEQVTAKIFNVHNAKPNYKVLNHGDCWTNNLMFHYNHADKVEDVAFVDFQSSCFTTPCLDLHYFLATSTNFESKNRLSAIVDHYFKNFVRILKKLRIKTIPTREKFDEDFRLFGYCGLGASIMSLPFVKSHEFAGASIEKFLTDDGTDSFRYQCFNNEDYLKEILHYLPFYDSLGIFDA